MSDAIAQLDWSDLYCQFQPKIQRYIYRRTSDYHLAEDLAADTFVKAIESVNGGAKIESLSGWLYRIAHNLVIDHYRDRDKLKTTGLDGAVLAPNSAPEQTLEQMVLRDSICKAIERTSENQQTVINMRLDGYEFHEIAEKMGKSTQACKGLQHRGFNTMHELLMDFSRLKRRPTRETNIPFFDMVVTQLRECGPMTVGETSIATNIKPSTVHGVIHRHTDTFVRVGSYQGPGRGGIMAIWGLVGVHDGKLG